MNVKVDNAEPAIIARYHDAAGGQADLRFGQGRIQSGVRKVKDLINPAPDKMFGAGPEQRLTGGIDPGDQMVRVDNNQSVAERSQNLIGRRTAVHQAAALFSQGV